MNKGIIVIGSAGSGKTTFLEELYKNNNEFEYVKWINPDFYVEDKGHEFYNNPLAASRYIKKEIFPLILSDERDFIFDTTGANLKTIKKLIDDNPSYEFKIVMIYCHPATVFNRNILRKRTLPRTILLENWHKVYSQVTEYEKLIKSGDMYIWDGYSNIEELELNNSSLYHISNIIKTINNKYDTTSSFKKKSTTYTEEEINKKEEQFIRVLDKIDEDYNKIYSSIKELEKSKEEIHDLLIKWI